MSSSYQPSFFDESERYIKLDKLSDPLVELSSFIDFEIFRDKLETVFEKPRKSNAGRKPLDVVFMFKILILQMLYNLSDEQVEFQINDRLSFCRFLGLPLGGSSPDSTTVCRFREALVKAGAVKPLFDVFAARDPHSRDRLIIWEIVFDEEPNGGAPTFLRVRVDYAPAESE